MIYILTAFISTALFANSGVIKCRLDASYEAYMGEGLVERGTGSLATVPVEFYFMSNSAEFTAKYVGGYGFISVIAKANVDEARINLLGRSTDKDQNFVGELIFQTNSGGTKKFSREQLDSMGYTAANGIRYAFSEASLTCSRPTPWDQRPKT